MIFHLTKVFFVILPFNKTKGIFLEFKFSNIQGQISDSINIAIVGFQKFKNFLVKKK